MAVLALSWMARGSDRSCASALVTSAARYAATAAQNRSAVLAVRDIARARGLLDAAKTMGGEREVARQTGVDVATFGAWLDEKEAEYIKGAAPPEVRKSRFSAAAKWR